MAKEHDGYAEVRVEVGRFVEDGGFDGEVASFLGREIDVWEGIQNSIDPNDQFGATIRLYECPLKQRDVGYRVYEFIWSLSPGSPSEGTLYPPVLDTGQYGLYSAEEVRDTWEEYLQVP